MNIELLQSTAKSLLDAHAPLAGISILVDDGTWPQTPDREAALEADGLVIIIWQESSGTKATDAVSRRRGVYDVSMAISVEENQVVNQSTGLGIEPGLVVREIITALSGYPATDPFETDAEAWSNLGDIDGVNTRIINLTNKAIF